MKYLCLIYGEEGMRANMSREQGETMRSEYMAYTDDIRKSGHWLGGEALQLTQTATTVRVRDGKVSTTDGPFAETKEQLGGFYLVEAKDLNDAIQVASRIPGAKHGSVEVRPILSIA
ncbi:MAG TPA: YciI family protein [Gemmatimonadaceae bacterium]|nr:YciI family protein [Gemmatimonadaceae bacterium]